MEIKIGAKWAKSFETISLLRKVGGPICSEWGKSFEPISLLTKVGIHFFSQNRDSLEDLTIRRVSEFQNSLIIEIVSKELVDLESL